MSDYSSTLMLSFVQSLGDDPSQPAGPGSESYDVYRDLFDKIQRWRTSIDKESVRREYNLLKANWSHRKGLIDAHVRLAGIDQKDRAAYLQAATQVKVASIGAAKAIASMKSTLNSTLMSKADQATSGLSGKSKSVDGWKALLGGLTQEEALGRTADVLLPGLIANMETEGYKISDLDGDLRRRAEKLLVRSKNAAASTEAYQKQITASEASIIALTEKLQGLSEGEDPSKLLTQLEQEAKTLEMTVTGATGSLPGSVVSARLKAIDGDRKTLETMEARFEALDQQLFAGGGVDSERKRFAQVIGRNNFKEWALDNGYSEQDIGIVEFDEDGKPIMGTYVQGRHTAKAIKHFEWQLQHPKKQSRLFGKGAGTNEVVSFMTKTDAEAAEKLKHSDGQWYTQEGPNGVQEYVTAAQITENKAHYKEPTVMQQGRVVKAGEVYYEVDPTKGAFTLLDKKPDGWDDAKATALVMTGENGKASRYVTAEDVANGRVNITKEGMNVAQASKIPPEDMQVLTEAAVEYQAHKSPPPEARHRISILRQRMHAWDVAGKGENRIRGRDINTGLMVTYKPEDITDVQLRRTKSTTDLKDFIGKVFYAPKVRAAVDKVEGADPDTITKRTMFGIEIEDHGDVGINVLDKMLYTGDMPDMSRAEKKVVEQETLTERLGEGLIAAEEVVNTTNAKYNATTARYTNARAELARLMNEDPPNEKAILEAGTIVSGAYADWTATRRELQDARTGLQKVKSQLDPISQVEATAGDMPEAADPLEMAGGGQGLPAIAGPDPLGTDAKGVREAARLAGIAEKEAADQELADFWSEEQTRLREEFNALLAKDQLTDDEFGRAGELLSQSNAFAEEERGPLSSQLRDKHMPALLQASEAKRGSREAAAAQIASEKASKDATLRRGAAQEEAEQGIGEAIVKAEAAEKRMAEIQSTVYPLLDNKMATEADLAEAKTLIDEYEDLAKFLNLPEAAGEVEGLGLGNIVRSTITQRESEFAKRQRTAAAAGRKRDAIAAMQAADDKGTKPTDVADVDSVPGPDPDLLKRLKAERERPTKTAEVEPEPREDPTEEEEGVGDIEFKTKPADITTGEAGAFLQGEEAGSPVRLAEALGQPGARSPTSTAKPQSGAGMVPAVSDKDMAHAKSLLRVQKEIRDALGLGEATA